LTALRAAVLAVHPEKLDPHHKSVITDQTDARELALKLDRYVNGNTRAMSAVRAPTAVQEQRRALSSQRESFVLTCKLNPGNPGLNKPVHFCQGVGDHHQVVFKLFNPARGP